MILNITSIPVQAQGGESDALAVRVVPNPDYLSPTRWYQENVKQQGSPSQLFVDGYQAVRDGRTVYVSAANIQSGVPGVNEDALYVNIYIISYTQEAINETIDIFGQLLNNWTFNVNLLPPDNSAGTGDCREITTANKPAAEEDQKKCYTDLDCDTGQYCDSAKAKVTRDVRRLSDIKDMETALNNYYQANRKYPKLAAGTYISSTTISVWPSWQETLAKGLGSALPIDPLNKLIGCNSPFNQDTCWDDINKKFNGFIPNDLPDNSHAYQYIALNEGLNYKLCAVMESGYTSGFDSNCAAGGGSGPTAGLNPAPAGNRLPIINTREEIILNNGESLSEHIYAYDPDGMITQWSVTGDGFTLQTTGHYTQRILKHEAFIFGTHTATITVTDNRGGITTITITITVPQCGNRTVERGEGCDPPNDTTCDLQCQLVSQQTTFCGDGKVQTPNSLKKNEQCDGKDGLVSFSADSSSTKQYACTGDCDFTGEYCGNGSIENIYGETCDFNVSTSETTNLDGTISEIKISSPIGVAASPGVSSSTNLYECVDSKLPNACTQTGGYCGDGIIHDGGTAVGHGLDHGEVCDKNSTSCTTIDGYLGTKTCKSNCSDWDVCTSSLSCGDGYKNGNEKCDNTDGVGAHQTCGNPGASDACKIINLTYCGDGHKDENEECDDDENNENVCTNACQWRRDAFDVPLAKTVDFEITGVNKNTPIPVPAIGPLTLNVSVLKSDSIIFTDDQTVAAPTQFTNPLQYSPLTDDSQEVAIKVGRALQTPYIWVVHSFIYDNTKYNPYSSVARIDMRTQAVTVFNLEKGGLKVMNPSRTAVNVENGEAWIVGRDANFALVSQDGAMIKVCPFAGGRGVVIDRDGNGWIGDNNGKLFQYDRTPNGCSPINAYSLPSSTSAGAIYGLAIDSKNNIWISNRAANKIQRFNTGTKAFDINIALVTILWSAQSNPEGYITRCNPYGIAIDSEDNIWVADTCKGVWRVDHTAPSTAVHQDLGGYGRTRGVAVDINGNIWVSVDFNSAVYKIEKNNSGNKNFGTSSKPENYNVTAISANLSYPIGLAGDTNDKMWVVNYTVDSNYIMGNNSRPIQSGYTTILDIVNNSVFKPDVSIVSDSTQVVKPYTYSDMSGLNRALLLRSGIWIRRLDSGLDNYHWGKISWEQILPSSGDADVVLTARAGDAAAALDAAEWGPSLANKSSTNLNGRYLDVKIFIRSQTRNQTPAVWNLQILQAD